MLLVQGTADSESLILENTTACSIVFRDANIISHLKNISSFLNPASGSWAATKTSVRRRRPSRNQHQRDVTQGVHGHGSVRGFARQLYILMPCLPQRYLFLRSFVLFFSFLIEKKPGDIC